MGLLQALEDIKGVHVEPRGQGKIDGVLAEYYVSAQSVFLCCRLEIGYLAKHRSDLVRLLRRTGVQLAFPVLLTDKPHFVQVLPLLTLRHVLWCWRLESAWDFRTQRRGSCRDCSLFA